ncbi:hypothetical protein MHYP_G00191240 [Metynnis hypsauchen]
MLSRYEEGDFVINSTQLSGTLCPEFPPTVTPFSLNLHLPHSPPPPEEQKRAHSHIIQERQAKEQKRGKDVRGVCL